MLKVQMKNLKKTASEIKLKINFICLYILFLNFKMYFWGFPRVLIQVNIYIHLHVEKCKEDCNIQKNTKVAVRIHDNLQKWFDNSVSVNVCFLLYTCNVD